MARAVRRPARVTDPTPGVALRDLLRTTPRLAPERAAAVLGGIAQALAARGAPHGALTPERVRVGAGDRVTLVPPPRPDVGPAPWPAYLAPEQIDGRPADARSDVYVLGLLGWEMLAGRPPWDGESLYSIVVKQREHDLPRLSTLRPGLPRPLVQAVEGALHKAPDDRWQHAAELLGVLGPTAARQAPTPPPPAAAPRAVPPVGVGVEVADDEADDPPRPLPASVARRSAPPAPRRRWLTVTALLLAALAAASGAYAVVRGRADTTATRAWLDSVTATETVGGTAAAAVPAVTTRENTTSAPIRRTGPRRDAPPEIDAESPDPDAPSELAVDTALAAPPEEEEGEPGAPVVRRPVRPTVPLDTISRPPAPFPPDPPR